MATTREKLLEAASGLFWTKGYGAVSLRDIAGAAGVDVALVSRYFGSKKGLFEATMEGAFHWPDILDPAGPDPAEVAVAKYASPKTCDLQMSVTRMIVMNAADPEVGDLVRAALRAHLLDPLQKRLGGDAQHLAMFVAVILGVSVARQNLALAGMVEGPPEAFEAQLRHLLDAALSFEPES